MPQLLVLEVLSTIAVHSGKQIGTLKLLNNHGFLARSESGWVVASFFIDGKLNGPSGRDTEKTHDCRKLGGG